MPPSSQARLRILDRIAEGKLSAEDGARMLEALADEKMPPPPIQISIGPNRHQHRKLIIRVIEIESQHIVVNLRLPLSLISTAQKLGAKISANVEDENLEKILHDLKEGKPGDSFRIEKESEIIELEIE
jgi:hypothetical protein